MSRYNFEGETAAIAQPQLDFIAQVLEKKGFKGPTVQVETVGEANDNYVANVKRIVIHENGETFKMIAKIAPDNEVMREMGNLQTSFQNEHVIYTEILPKFRELQKSVQVPEEDWFTYAECYGSCPDAPNEILLLEDLAESKFQMCDKLKPLSNDAVKLVLKNFAIYHSLSYVLKNEEPETYEEYKSKLTDFFSGAMAERDEMKMFMQQMEQTTLAVLEDDKHKNVVTGSVGNILSQAVKLIKSDKGSKGMVIQQGDAWTNNIMFQMKDGVPVLCTLIDYQLSKENNPVYDIMYMVFNSTSYEQRKKHFHEFIDYYHAELNRSLNNFGLKANLIYPRDKLDADMKRYGKYLLSTSIMVSTFILKTAEEASTFKESASKAVEINEENLKKMFAQTQNTQILFKEKVEGLINSFLELGLL